MNRRERQSVVDAYKAVSEIDRDDGVDDELSHAQLRLTGLKDEISSLSRNNYRLEQDVQFLDSRIALLIADRIETSEMREVALRLEALPTAGRAATILNGEQLQLYGSLFMLLQSDPSHIANLCMRVPLADIDTLLETVMFSIYGNHFDPREEHLLLVMFQQVLAHHFDVTDEFASLLRGNSAATRMMMTYTRRGTGQAYLQRTLGEPLRRLLSSADSFDLNLTRVFNELAETNPGDVGYQVPLKPSEFSSHPKAQEITMELDKRFYALQRFTTDLLNIIFDSLNEVPYGVRWVAKQVRLLARRRFPEASDNQISSLLGGYFFLRYINPAIVTPHAFLLVKDAPNPRARRNLTMVAKLVQLMANQSSLKKEVWTVDIPGFVRQFTYPMIRFLSNLCDVPDFYDSLEVDQYMALQVPQRHLVVSYREVVETHQLVAKYLPPEGRLGTLLQELGKPPAAPPRGGATAKTQLELPLANRWVDAILQPDAAEQSTLKASALFLQSKVLMVNLRRAFPNQKLSLVDLADFASHSSDPAIAGRGMRAHFMLAEYSADELEFLSREVENETQKLGSLLNSVRSEYDSLKVVYNVVNERNQYLESQLDVFRSYLNNVRLKTGPAGRASTSVTPQWAQQHGIIETWPYSPDITASIRLALERLSAGTWVLALTYRDRSRPIWRLIFTRDDLLMLESKNEAIDIGFRLQPGNLLAWAGQ